MIFEIRRRIWTEGDEQGVENILIQGDEIIYKEVEEIV
jgi:hypothetical protein